MVTLLAPISGDTLPLSKALTGRLEETYLNTEDVLKVNKGKYFNEYVGSCQTFLGIHTKVDLQMADGSQLYAVTLIPQDDYLRASTLQWICWMIGAIVILAILLILSIHLSRSFARPISQSLELIRNEGSLRRECSGVSEIDELFDFMTPTEHNILRYYADGKGVNEVAEQACISINTVRRHNANIYQKLGVGSREELLLYIELFRRCDRLDQLI